MFFTHTHTYISAGRHNIWNQHAACCINIPCIRPSSSPLFPKQTSGRVPAGHMIRFSVPVCPRCSLLPLEWKTPATARRVTSPNVPENTIIVTLIRAMSSVTESHPQPVPDVFLQPGARMLLRKRIPLEILIY